jgi:hypothetical protein
MTEMTFAIDLFFAGVWSMVWHWGIGIGLIILLCAAAWFSPVFKKDFLYAALIVFVALFFEAVGIKDERARVTAQEVIINQKVDDVVKSTETPASRTERDPYDSMRN